MVIPPVREVLDRAREHLGVDREHQILMGGVDLGDLARPGPCADQRSDHDRRLPLDLRDLLCDLRVGGVAEQRAPRLTMLFHEREERVHPKSQPLLTRCARRTGVRLQAAEDLAGMLHDEFGVQLALRREVLVDQRL